MARSVSYRRTTTSSRSHRSTARRVSSKRRHRPLSSAEEAPSTPDVAELRRLRQTYYDTGAGAGRKEGSLQVRKTSSAYQSERSRSERKSRGKPTSAGLSRSPRVKVDRTTEYVYATAIATGDEELKSGRVRRGSRTTTEDADGLSTIPEAAVTPEDSVSQIGTRRRRSRRLKSTLRVVSEKAEKPPQDSSKSTKDSFLGSIFSRRRSTTTTDPVLVDCLTCGADDTPVARSAKLECGHRMCHSCLKRIFKLAVHDPAHMPPRCCTEHPIPLKHVDKLFDLRFKLIFNKKYDEFRTKDRTYCPNRRCGVWIRPADYHSSNGKKYGQCRRCKTKACLQCGMKLHKSKDCPKDPEMVKLTEEAEKQGWKRCYSCNAMVELRDGCNHMTCRCMAEFCMVCGAKWKSCDCPLFSLGAVPGFDMADGLADPFAFLHRHLFGQEAPAIPVVDGYRQELRVRRQQERIDEDLAQRMHLAAI